MNKSSEFNHIDLYKDPIFNNIVRKVQQSKKLPPPVIPTSPFSRENLQILKKFPFQISDFSFSQKFHLCKILVENEHCYATHRIDVRKISPPFWIRC